MDKLRGTGQTFSTSGKRWLPFRHNRKLARKQARLRSLVKAGLTGHESKAELRQAAADAAANHRINRIPTGKRTTSNTIE